MSRTYHRGPGDDPSRETADYRQWGLNMARAKSKAKKGGARKTRRAASGKKMSAKLILGDAARLDSDIASLQQILTNQFPGTNIATACAPVLDALRAIRAALYG
jgi:hypothetical protein